MSEPLRIGMVGGGRRARVFASAARALPHRFSIPGFLVRSPATAARLTAELGIPATTSAADFLAQDSYDFVVVCVPRDEAPALIRDFVGRGVPVLCETPPAPDEAGLRALYGAFGSEAPIQVAEQYRFQPHHAARLQAVGSGLLGTPSSADLSVAHDYHAMSLLRAFLGIGWDEVTVSAEDWEDRVVASLGFDGWSADAAPTTARRLHARLSFPDRGLTAVHDFSGEQYFSPIRSRHLRVRGDRGELHDDSVTVLRGPADYAQLEFRRQQTGLDGIWREHSSAGSCWRATRSTRTASRRRGCPTTSWPWPRCCTGWAGSHRRGSRSTASRTPVRTPTWAF